MSFALTFQNELMEQDWHKDLLVESPFTGRRYPYAVAEHVLAAHQGADGL